MGALTISAKAQALLGVSEVEVGKWVSANRSAPDHPQNLAKPRRLRRLG